jgi:hypothetical protein
MELRYLRCMGFASLMTLLVSIVGLESGHAATEIIDFDDLDASTTIVGASVATYLTNYGITVSGPDLSVFDVRNFTDGGVEFTAPASRLNFLGGSTSPQVNTLGFDQPLLSFSFTRNGLIVTGPGGTSHPRWSATAFDENGASLSTVGENLIATFMNISQKTFTLAGPGIASIVFDSDNLGFAGYGAIIMDDLTLVTVPEPSTAILAALAFICVRGHARVSRRLVH